jgi:hypothetical protein
LRGAQGTRPAGPGAAAAGKRLCPQPCAPTRRTPEAETQLGRLLRTTRPALHQQTDASGGCGQHVQAGSRVAVDHQQVGPGAGQQLADLAFGAQQARGGDGGALQHLHRAHGLQADAELGVLLYVHVAQQVGAEDDRHAFGPRDAHRLHAAVAHLVELGQHLGAPAQA